MIPRINQSQTFLEIGALNKLPKEIVMDDLKRMINHGRLITLDEGCKKIPADKKYVEENLLPGFLKFYETWPQGYKLVMKQKGFAICVAKNEAAFSTYGAYPKGGMYTPAMSLMMRPDKGVLCVNAGGGFNQYCTEHSIYHELIHQVSQFAVKDDSKIRLLSVEINKKYNGKLTSLAKNYMSRQQTAEQEFNSWLKENKKASKKEIYEAFIAALNANRCWAYREIGSYESLEDYFKICYLDPHDAEEILAFGLMAYLGSEKTRACLKEQEFGLYDIIERTALPYVK